ncbi:MAG: M23 family peptidase [Alphaproteobacteria bacterium]|nr:MAG: M23 family peptidase [Alphaproteobacteria bacterium]
MSSYRPPVRSSADHGQPEFGRGRARPLPATSDAGTKSDWTLGHGGRQVRVRPVAFWIIVGSLVVMAGWSAVTATYFAFRDDVLTRLLARQAQMQYAYEDRIADLRGQVDRLASRQLLDQEQVESKLEQIARRQAVLESRSAALSSLPDPGATGSIKPGPRAAVPSILPAQSIPKPSPINDTVILVPPPEREARLESRTPFNNGVRLAAGQTQGGIDGALARLQVALDRYEANQIKTLNTLEESYDAKARRMRSVLADLGLDLNKVAPSLPARASGGPFVPASPASTTSFERQLYRIKLVRGQVERLTRTLGTVPIRKPMMGELDSTSGFGMRTDPFLRALAMHTGLDIRADTGEAARATAAGTVTMAGWNGGYGKMVEVDHGNGFATRYAHLSAIDVELGQTIRIGQIVGRVGSTGRSTGPHLHYETRVDGDPVDPQRFLRAGVRLGGAL